MCDFVRFLFILYLAEFALAWGASYGVEIRIPVAFNTLCFYFAYDINMLDTIMQSRYPNATFYGHAVLRHHRLDFIMEVPRWKGALATISKDPGAEVWGVLWVIQPSDVRELDNIEEVSAGWYHSQEVVVFTKNNKKIKAITLVQNLSPKKLLPCDPIPEDRQPSVSYLKIMALGAIKGGLPIDYIKYLINMKHNNEVASGELLEKIEKEIQDIE